MFDIKYLKRYHYYFMWNNNVIPNILAEESYWS